ncbi:MAG TPA: PaaX family transcriptional regulator C-terminal domain-containing protein [Candidatus Nitrosopolaris sp.]|nr:PaaX family transcriptional regulator C-terminal domain-containing protein [Candidatus Nitrosopolaris sp.]
MRPTARSLILDLLSTLRRGSMPVRALVAAGKFFGIAENSLRVAVTRLLADGLVERDERGQYRAGARAETLDRWIKRWRTIDEGTRSWDGTWVVALGVTPPARRASSGEQNPLRALRFLAFRELVPGVHVRPDNLVGGVAGMREQLHALGLPPDVAVGALRDLDGLTDARVRRLWDVRALRRAYRDTVAALAASEARLAELPPHEAMVESFLLGGRTIRQLVLDPLLPESLVPAAERAALVAAMRRYDRVGRACWASFMRGFDILPEARAPVDLRIIERVGELEGVGT